MARRVGSLVGSVGLWSACWGDLSFEHSEILGTLRVIEWANGTDGEFQWIDSAARSENAPYRRRVDTRGSILDASSRTSFTHSNIYSMRK